MTGRLRSALLIGATLTALAAGCHKNQESLIVLSISTDDGQAAALTNVIVTCDGVSRTFELATPLSATPQQIGLYVASDVVGSQIVSAAAGAGSVAAAELSAYSAGISRCARRIHPREEPEICT